MATKGLENFYRQRKSSSSSVVGGKSKPSPASKRSPNIGVSFGSDHAQPAALVSHGSLDLRNDCGEEEEMLRQFDMDMTYGPCLGMTRLQRWERARNMGLNPPKDVECLLQGDGGDGGDGRVGVGCLWEGRV
ncbi:hypothetical protein QJS04_geneDACA012251 [Acorus gramineus]|uniref:DNA polymerase delta subunit 4 n=1 Tax=Acorus gramineus TaxID=55184 RepID=A0AAV9B7Q4_ACOGR|nr:hypothetical protein QJS04_geneDACA012251 [Acorus gramineus]